MGAGLAQSAEQATIFRTAESGWPGLECGLWVENTTVELCCHFNDIAILKLKVTDYTEGAVERFQNKQSKKHSAMSLLPILTSSLPISVLMWLYQKEKF